MERPIVVRSDYVAAEHEAFHLILDEQGYPDVWLVHTGDRMSVWSPRGGGALINPKSAALRRAGLRTCYIRGGQFYRAFKEMDLRAGRAVALRREKHNEHDANAVALLDSAGRTVGYTQRGRAPALVRLMDDGQKLEAVTMRGSTAGDGEDTAFILVGERRLLRHVTG